jgi:hypothetical protein
MLMCKDCAYSNCDYSYCMKHNSWHLYMFIDSITGLCKDKISETDLNVRENLEEILDAYM